ncbi:hypothetical protein OEA41_006001 [Lepraria neglecta]|uniref:Nephrocystin 3-like N-terminal domain-containing protein n=1 Tax=Lepraria neglecta TaxID=209136 RepID=A0AAE0DJU5_9LECA|nr:hypothetical protein OEA41_006001 [Lepraria neglecta]
MDTAVEDPVCKDLDVSVAEEPFEEEEINHADIRKKIVESLDMRYRHETVAKPLELVFEVILEQSRNLVHICLFIDALDEYEGSVEVIVEFLRSILGVPATAATQVQVCFSSRPSLSLDQMLDISAWFRIQDQPQQDIKDSVNERLELDHRRDSYPGAGILAREIVDRAQGSFLWAQLVVQSVMCGESNGGNFGELKTRIYTTPQDISNMYDAIFGDVDAIHGERVFNMLEIVRRSKTWLGLSDFIAALAYASFDTIEDCVVQIPLELPTSSELQMVGRELMGLCRGLSDVVDGSENPTVQFVPEIVQNFVSRPESLSKWLPQRQQSVQKTDIRFSTNADLAEVSTGSSQQAFLDRIDDQVMKFTSIKHLHKHYGTYYPIDSVLTFAVVANLRLYIAEKLQADLRLVRGSGKSLPHCVAKATLTEASITSNYDHGVQFFERPHDLTQMASLLITYGIGHNNIFQGSTPFQLLFH